MSDRLKPKCSALQLITCIGADDQRTCSPLPTRRDSRTAMLRGGLLHAASAVISLGLCASALTTMSPVHAQTTLTVTNNTDASGQALTGSLRQVLEYAAFNGAYGGAPFTVNFAIGTGQQTIALTSPLPLVNFATVIDGYTQPTATPNTLPNNIGGSNAAIRIVLDGTSVISASGGIYLSAANSAVRGLSIVGFGTSPGIFAAATNVSIDGNFIGVLPDGTARPNSIGVTSAASGVVVGGATPAARNVVACNLGAGVNGGADIRNNEIGTRPDGTTACANGGAGINLAGGVANIGGAGVGNFIRNNTGDGITVAGASNFSIIGNTITGNSGKGINIIATECASNGVRIRANNIGPNGGLGIDLAPLGRDVNDALDIDVALGCITVANRGQNYPVFDLVTYRPNATAVTFTVASEASKTYDVEVFSSANADTSDAGKG